MNRLRISDHAMMRFLERAGGLDVEGLRAMLETSLSRAAAAAAAIGAGNYIIKSDGMVFPVRQGTDGPVVTTVLPEEDEPGRRAHGQWPQRMP